MREGDAGELRLDPAGDLVRGLRKGARTALTLVKVVFPLYVLVNLLKASGALTAIASVFVPLMKYLGLPGEAALALIAGYLGNIYAGLAVVSAVGMSPRDVTVIGLMLGLSHSLLIEAAVFQKMGTRPVAITLFRVGMSVAAGLAVNLVMPS